LKPRISSNFAGAALDWVKNAMPGSRRFPPPWSAEETDACFIVRDGNRQALTYVYFEEGRQ
jgi:hypothetical protein